MVVVVVVVESRRRRRLVSERLTGMKGRPLTVGSMGYEKEHKGNKTMCMCVYVYVVKRQPKRVLEASTC